MKGWQWVFLVASVTAGAVFVLVPALGGDESEGIERYAVREIASGDWTLTWAGVDDLRVTAGPVTGLAFGPGRTELACCAPATSGGPSALWTTHITSSAGDRRSSRWRPPLGVSARLIASAPPETTFRGPIWWSSDGSQIALRACAGESNRLVIVDYLSGEMTAVPDSDNVVEAAWSPDGGQTALVREKEGTRSVWAYSRETGESRRLGAGGYDLRWSLDGTGLYWLRDDSEEAWTAVRWDLSSGALEMGGPRPARATGALWSPDGQLCAALEPPADGGADQIVLYPTDSPVGEPVPLPGLKPERLLGWSPDSRFLLVLARGNMLAAVSARPPGSGVSEMRETMRRPAYARAALSSLSSPYQSIDAEAACPTWSSSGEWLVYTMGPEELVSRLSPGSSVVVVQRIRLRYFGGTALQAKIEREAVERNLKVIALGMLMYLNDWDKTFPYSDDVDYLRGALHPYIQDQSVFMRPGTDNSVVVSFTIDPGAPLRSLEAIASTPIATIDYSPEFYGVAYADGHAKIFEKE